jgi:hypothetical protein
VGSEHDVIEHLLRGRSTADPADRQSLGGGTSATARAPAARLGLPEGTPINEVPPRN